MIGVRCVRYHSPVNSTESQCIMICMLTGTRLSRIDRFQLVVYRLEVSILTLKFTVWHLVTVKLTPPEPDTATGP